MLAAIPDLAPIYTAVAGLIETELLKRSWTMPGSTSPHHDHCGHLFCRKSKTKNNS
jgi:hypothetical protein